MIINQVYLPLSISLSVWLSDCLPVDYIFSTTSLNECGVLVSISIAPKDRYVVPDIACVDQYKTECTLSVELHFLSKEYEKRQDGADENRHYYHVTWVLGLHHLDLMLISFLHASHCSDWNDNYQAYELTTHDWSHTKFKLTVLYSDNHVYEL